MQTPKKDPGAAAQSWDPLTDDGSSPEIVARATKREIQNILKSYTGYYDIFAELIQNSLDAVEKRITSDKKNYKPKVIIKINMNDDSITIIDNGCGMNESEFRTFMRPNFSYKDGINTRGSKGVGATYLAYGFNELLVASRQNKSNPLCGIIRNGRKWLDDAAQIVSRPLVVNSKVDDADFVKIDSGTYMRVKLVGDGIRPKDLAYYHASLASQWMPILRVHTAIGGL